MSESAEQRPAAQASIALSQMMFAPAGAPPKAPYALGAGAPGGGRLRHGENRSGLSPGTSSRPNQWPGAYHGEPDLKIPTPFEIHREAQDDVITFRLRGTFDSRAAVYLRKELKEVDAARVVIDFSGTNQLVEVGVALLSGALQSGSVELRGLDRRQAAIFRYFDIEVEPERSATEPDSPAAELDSRPTQPTGEGARQRARPAAA